MTTIGINAHHHRAHSPEGGLAHFTGRDEVLLRLVREAVDAGAFSEDATDAGSARRCVRLLGVRGVGFYCGIVDLVDGMMLRARPARDGERFMQPRVARWPGLTKAPAVCVDVYLYSAAALAEGDEASTDCDWEVVGMSARPVDGREPTHPISMMRNQLGHDGGTRITYSSEEWAAAVEYWSTRALLDAEEWA